MMVPGEYFLSKEPVTANAGKEAHSIRVSNTGDRPIQVGSHAHFFEANRALSFPRAEAYGCRLNIPAGTSVRFEPGDTITVEVTGYGGKRVVWGFSGLVNGPLDENRDAALQRAKEKGFGGA